MLVHSLFKRTKVTVETRSTFHKVIVRVSMIIVLTLSIVTLIGIIFLNAGFSAWILSWPVYIVVAYIVLLIATAAVYATKLFTTWNEFLENLLPIGVLPFAVAVARIFIRINVVVCFWFVITSIFTLLGIIPALAMIPVLLFAVAELIITIESVYQWGINDTKLQLEELARNPQNP